MYLGSSISQSVLHHDVPVVERLLKPRPLLLVRDGEVLWSNMRRELVTIAELESQLRLQGIAAVDAVERAWMESDGRISAITKDGAADQSAPEPRSA